MNDLCSANILGCEMEREVLGTSQIRIWILVLLLATCFSPDLCGLSTVKRKTAQGNVCISFLLLL